MYLLVSLLQLNALVAGNGSYILWPCGHDLHGPTIPTLAREYLPWLGEVPTFFAWVSMLAMRVPSLMGAVLTLTGVHSSAGGIYLCLGEGIYPGQGDVPSLVI